MQRADGRFPNQLRDITFETGYVKCAEGSALVRFGDTVVLCNATLEEKLPHWLKNKPEPHGWLTAEYAMLPRSGHRRSKREQRWPKGRTQEISRLIGRSLRMALDLELLGERTVTIDCDVLQADGGTRTASVTGGWVALSLALQPLIAAGKLPTAVIKHQITAVSVGIVDGMPLLDLPYTEDSAADVDLNVVMTAEGGLIEIQGTGEKTAFTHAQLNALLALAADGSKQIATLQMKALQR